jgi:hypothetical protein
MLTSMEMYIEDQIEIELIVESYHCLAKELDVSIAFVGRLTEEQLCAIVNRVVVKGLVAVNIYCITRLHCSLDTRAFLSIRDHTDFLHELQIFKIVWFTGKRLKLDCFPSTLVLLYGVLKCRRGLNVAVHRDNEMAEAFGCSTLFCVERVAVLQYRAESVEFCPCSHI